MSEDLKQILFNEYDGFSDKRIKNLKKGNTFIVDELDSSDFGSASQQLLGGRCRVFLKVNDTAEIELSLTKSVPLDDNVRKIIQDTGGIIEKSGVDDLVKILIDLKKLDVLSSLATAFEQIIKKPYSEPSFKYSCPKTATALRRLKKVLATFKNN